MILSRITGVGDWKLGLDGGRRVLLDWTVDFFLRRVIGLANELRPRFAVLGPAGARSFGFHLDAQRTRRLAPIFSFASVLLAGCYGH